MVRVRSQVLHNIALTEAQLGHWEKAQESLVKALDYRTESKLGVIDNALQATLVRVPSLTHSLIHQLDLLSQQPLTDIISPSTEAETFQINWVPFKSAL